MACIKRASFSGNERDVSSYNISCMQISRIRSVRKQSYVNHQDTANFRSNKLCQTLSNKSLLLYDWERIECYQPIGNCSFDDFSFSNEALRSFTCFGAC